MMAAACGRDMSPNLLHGSTANVHSRSSQHGERVRGRATDWCHCAPFQSTRSRGRGASYGGGHAQGTLDTPHLLRRTRRHRDDPHGRLLALPVRARSSRGRGLARHRARQGGPLWTRPRREYAGAGDQFVTKAYEDMAEPASRGDGQGRHDRRTGHRGDRDAPDDLGRPRDGRGLELRHRGEAGSRRRRLAGPVEPRARGSGSRRRRDARPREEVAPAGGHRRPVREQAHDRARGCLTSASTRRRSRARRRHVRPGSSPRSSASTARPSPSGSLRRAREPSSTPSRCASPILHWPTIDRIDAIKGAAVPAMEVLGPTRNLGHADSRPGGRGDSRADREVGGCPRGGRHGGPERPPASATTSGSGAGPGSRCTRSSTAPTARSSTSGSLFAQPSKEAEPLQVTLDERLRRLPRRRSRTRRSTRPPSSSSRPRRARCSPPPSAPAPTALRWPWRARRHRARRSRSPARWRSSARARRQAPRCRARTRSRSTAACSATTASTPRSSATSRSSGPWRTRATRPSSASTGRSRRTTHAGSRVAGDGRGPRPAVHRLPRVRAGHG